MNQTWLKSSINSPCPVCGRTKDGDCRWHFDLSVILCHTYQDGPDTAGYKYAGNSEKGAGWGKFYKPFEKPPRPKAETYFDYYSRDGSPLVRVQRKDLGNGKKEFYQQHWNGSGWSNGAGDHRAEIPIYRYSQVRAAIEAGQEIFWVEGEATADSLWQIGIPATTTIGGSGGLSSYGKQYRDDVAGGSVVICPDRDEEGLKYAKAVEDLLGGAGVAGWCKAFPGSPEWGSLPKKNGADLRDWIDAGATQEQILRAVTSGLSSLSTSTKTLTDKKIDKVKPAQGRDSGDFVEFVNLSSEEKQEISQQLEEIQAWSNERLDLRAILPEALGTALHHKADSMPCSVEFLFQPFVSITAGLIGTSRIQVKRGWTEPAVIWTGLIAEPGSLKSPGQSVVHKPLLGLQIDAEELHKFRVELYEQEIDKWTKSKPQDRGAKPKEPNRRHYYLSDFTMEALVEKHSTEENRSGFSVVCDELSGLFLGLNQHKSGGKGNDRPRLLSLWNGGDIKKDTRGKEGEIFLPETSVSITGPIQSRVLQKLISDPDDPDGLWGRFLWAAPPYIPDKWNDLEVDIYDILKGLYCQLDRIPKITFELSPKARSLFAEYTNWIVDQKEHATDAIKNVLSKLKGYGARLALWLHCVEWAFDSSTESTAPLATISAATTAKALKLAHYYLRQAQLLHSSESKSEIPDPLGKIVKLSKSCPVITARILQRKGWVKTAEEGRQALQQLATLGIGTITGEGNKIQWEVTRQLDNLTNYPQPFIPQGFDVVESELTKTPRQVDKPSDPTEWDPPDPSPGKGFVSVEGFVSAKSEELTKPDPGGGSDPVTSFNTDEWEEF